MVNISEEIEKISKEIEKYPNNSELWYQKGILLEKLGKFKEAEESFKKALSLNPDFKLASTHLMSLSKLINYQKDNQNRLIETKSNSLKEKSDIIINFYNKYSRYFTILFVALFIISLVISFDIRIANLPYLTGGGSLFDNNYLGQGGSLTGLDPYLFYEALIHIINSGVPPVINHLQYPPIGYPMRYTDILVSYFGAFLYNSFHFITHGTPIDWFILVPPISALLIVAIIFLIVYELTKNYPVSIFSALVFSAFQTNLSRSSAGFSQKTEFGYLFIFLIILLLIKSVKSKKIKSKLIFSILAWISLGIDYLTTGYVQYLFVIIPVFYLLLVLLHREEESDIYSFLISPIWIIVPVLGDFSLGFLTSNPLFFSVFRSSTLGYWLAWVEFLIFFIYDNTIKEFKFFKHRDHAYLALIITILALLLVFIIPKLSSVKSLIISELLHPLGVGKVNPVTLTIAEYGTVTLQQRYQDFGFTLFSGSNTIGINMLLYYAGALLILYYLVKRYKHYRLLYALLVPLIFLMNEGPFSYGLGEAAIFGLFTAFLVYVIIIADKKYSNKDFILFGISVVLLAIFSSLLQNANPVSVHYYVYSAIAILVIIFVFSILDEELKVGENYNVFLFLESAFIVFLALSNTEVRLLQPMEITGAIFIGIFVYKAFEFIYKRIDFKSTLITWSIIGAISVFLIFDLYISLYLANIIVQQNGSGLTFWGPAFVWIRNNTPVNTSIVSWWDYGYWIQAIGNRTSVADGSNAYGYQSMIAKYLFTAESPYIYSTYLNFITKPGYFLISGNEIGKFTAITTISSNAEKPVYLGILAPASQSVISDPITNLSSKYPYAIYLVGSAPIQSNYYYQGLNFSNSLLVGALIPWNGSRSSISGFPIGTGNPYAIVYNSLTNQLYTIPFKYNCIYKQGCFIINKSGFPGGFELLNASPLQTVQIATPSFNYPDGIQSVQINLSNYGDTLGALFIPNDTLNTLFAKLYLLGENVTGFKLVYSNGVPANSLISVTSQVITNVNIYEINYTQLSRYNLTSECSPNPKSVNYCDNLSFLPDLFSQKLPNSSELYGV